MREHISDVEALESKVDKYIDVYLRKGHFSGSILIARKGKVLVSKGYGKANFEHDVPNTPHTKFRLGSITKQFTSLAIMQLQERGLLNVDDPLKKYIPDYPNGEKITIHHLLTHTSGIPNLTDFPEYSETMMISSRVETTIERFKHKPLRFTSGEKFEYSNQITFSWVTSSRKSQVNPMEHTWQKTFSSHLAWSTLDMIVIASC